MKYVSEFRDPAAARVLLAAIAAKADQIGASRAKPLHIMETCGGHTHAIFCYGLDKLIHQGVEFIHGPGCPVCVLPMARVDECVEIAKAPRGDLHNLRRCDEGAGVQAQPDAGQGGGGGHPHGLFSP